MICTICGKEYDGYTTSKTCSIKCKKEHLKRYRREYYRKYRKTTKAKEHHRAYSRKYRQENKEKINERYREWHRNNPEKRKQYNEECNRKKTLSRYTEEQISRFEELAFRQQFLDDYDREGKCIICGKNGVMILHHISYDPVETILMCTKCHSTLHNTFLKGIKCKPK